MGARATGRLKLVPGVKTYEAEVRLRVDEVHPGRVQLELDRVDSKPSPVIELSLDSARTLLRLLQSACDQADRLAYAAHKQARAAVQMDQVVDRVARVLDVDQAEGR